VSIVPNEQFYRNNNRDEDIAEKFEEDNTTVVIEEYAFHKENLFTAPVYDSKAVDPCHLHEFISSHRREKPSLYPLMRTLL